MILAVDIGNSSTVAGVVDSSNGTVVAHKRFATEPERAASEYLELFSSLVATLGKSGASGGVTSGIDGAIICSVVPKAVPAVAASLVEIVGAPVSVVSLEKASLEKASLGGDAGAADGSGAYGPEVKLVAPAMELDVDTPSEVGADRVVNAVAAFELFGGPVVVVDFGTALTLDYVNGDGVYCGGIIAPGIGISLEALHARTAKLPLVTIDDSIGCSGSKPGSDSGAKPCSIVGRNTVEAIKSGVYWGTVSMVDGIIERIERERGALGSVVATGGFAGTLAACADSVDEVDEFLTLKGLGLIYERNH
ncbi:MAG: type III pantothenate kinase [Proteobacteria bacterium]|nr:type III pantothenate kinase [Pseudomonadota bacterium]